jgi:hypothetical protein
MPRQQRNSKRGAPPGNTNARTHGGYQHQHRQGDAARAKAAGGEVESTSPKNLPGLPDLIADLWKHQQDLTEWMKDNATSPAAQDGHYIAAMNLYGQNAARLGRLLRYSTALGSDRAAKLATAMNDALDSMATELGIDL